MSIFEVLFFLTLLVYTAPHNMVFGAVNILSQVKQDRLQAVKNRFPKIEYRT